MAMPALQQPLFGTHFTPEGEIRSPSQEESEGAVYQEINDPVDVLVLFEDGTLKPQRFRWKGHVHRVAQITGRWKTDKGTFRMKHFALMDEEANFFQLAYDERSSGWRVTRVWVE
jgi:hypothetical protein